MRERTEPHRTPQHRGQRLDDDSGYAQTPDQCGRDRDHALGAQAAATLAGVIEQSTGYELENELRQELILAFTDLGGAAFALVHHRVLDDKRLDPAVRRIYELSAQLNALTRMRPRIRYTSASAKLASA